MVQIGSSCFLSSWCEFIESLARDDEFHIFEFGLMVWNLGRNRYDLRFFVYRSFQALFSCCGFEDYSDLGVLCFLKALIFTRVIIKGIKFVLQRHCEFANFIGRFLLLQLVLNAVLHFFFL